MRDRVSFGPHQQNLLLLLPHILSLQVSRLRRLQTCHG